MSAHCQNCRRLREALKQALDLAREGWCYAPVYFQDKWRCNERMGEIAQTARPTTDGGSDG